MALTSVTVALDWSFNTNHTGFLVAQDQGFYEQEGLKADFIEPTAGDGYTPPAELVRSGKATFAVTPSESVISSNTLTQTQRPLLQAVAAVLQTDTSAIVTLKKSGLHKPKMLDGKVYASYGARYEGRIVQELIRADGGQGDFTEATPPVMGIFDTLLKGEADATWIFRGWEGVDAQLKGVELNTFSLDEYGVPYGYTPVLAALPQTLKQQPEVVRGFLRASSRGFQSAAQHPAEAADILCKAAPALDRRLAHASQEYVSKHYLDGAGQWGRMEGARWEYFVNWLSEKGLLTSAMPSRNPVEGVSASLDDLRQGRAGASVPRDTVSMDALFTNAFLPS